MTASLEREIQSLEEIQGSEHDPGGRAFVHLADARRRSGELDRALEIVREGLERHPEFSSAHVVAAWVHRDRGEDDEAGAAFRRVLELDQENTAALRGLGELAEAQGSVDAALGWFNRLAALAPEDQELAERIRTLEEREREALAAEHGDAEAFSDLDEILVRERESAEADDDFVRMDSVGDESDLGDILTMGQEVDAEAGEPEAELPEPEGQRDLELPEAEGPDAELEEVDAELDAAEEPEGADDEEVRTETMGELYARQGLHYKAVEVFEHLVEERPDDERLRARLAELREKAEDGAPAVGAAAATEESVEELAREMSSGEGATGDLDTPFAWDEDAREAALAGGGEESGERISSYFGRLLTWGPEGSGALPEPASETVPTVPVESLAPDVPIESLAPDGEGAATGFAGSAGSAEPVPIESLAPDGGGAATGATGPAEPVPIESLAPDEDDDFDHWLDRLK